MKKKKTASAHGEKKRSNTGRKKRETKRESKMERTAREERDAMRHCVVVKREMGHPRQFF